MKGQTSSSAVSSQLTAFTKTLCTQAMTPGSGWTGTLEGCRCGWTAEQPGGCRATLVTFLEAAALCPHPALSDQATLRSQGQHLCGTGGHWPLWRAAGGPALDTVSNWLRLTCTGSSRRLSDLIRAPDSGRVGNWML